MRGSVDGVGGSGDSIRDVDVLILGAGVSGVAAAAGCLQAGIDDVVLIERATGIGGTWLHNTYPGCAVDIPTHVYSFSWALNADWSRVFAPRHEIQAYLERAATESGVADKVELDTELTSARWDGDIQRWIVVTTAGVYRARFFVSAAGPLHEPMIPDLPGLGDFAGECFHSSRWPADAELDGKRVVVVGTGASALQFVPAIQPQVESLTILQRTPAWVMPKPDWAVSGVERRLLRRLPPLLRFVRLALWAFMDLFLLVTIHHPRVAALLKPVGRWHMRRFVTDPDTRQALTPEYVPTCKRIGLSNDFYRAVGADNVRVIPHAASAVGPGSVTTADGQEVTADVLILGTGFHTLQTHPVNERIVGRDGHTLAQEWNGSPTAHLGTTVAGFPNAFFMFGPNVGTLSGFVMAEAQTEYIVGALKAARDLDLGMIDVTPEAQARFVETCDAKLARSTLARGGCSSYYLASDGSRVSLAWPGSMTGLKRALARFDIESYITEPRREPSATGELVPDRSGRV